MNDCRVLVECTVCGRTKIEHPILDFLNSCIEKDLFRRKYFSYKATGPGRAFVERCVKKDRTETYKYFACTANMQYSTYWNTLKELQDFLGCPISEIELDAGDIEGSKPSVIP